jgi:hypothetical protein
MMFLSRVNFFKSVFILSCLGFFLANVSVIVNGKEDQGGYFFHLLLIFIVLAKVFEAKKNIYNVYSWGIMPMYSLGFLLSIVNIIYYELSPFLLIMPLGKFIIIYGIFLSVRSFRVENFYSLLRVMVILLIMSYALSIIFYIFYPAPEFVLYDGGRRFAGLHFELVNFLYSSIIMLLVVLWDKDKSKIAWLSGLFVLYFITSSNLFYILLIVLIFAYIVSSYNAQLINIFSNIFLCSLFILPLIIGFLLNDLSILQIFEVRDAANFNANGSQLFIRLYPWQLSTRHLLEHFFSLPPGIGMTKNFIHEEGYYGGTGISAIYSDFGILAPVFYVVLINFFSKTIKMISILKNGRERRLMLSILLLSTVYITVQSGFFNIFVWTFILLIRQYVLLITKRNIKL